MPSNDKFNLDGVSVTGDNEVIADGGFIGDLTGGVTGSITGSYEQYDSDGAINVGVNLAYCTPLGSTLNLTIGEPVDGHTIRIIGGASINDIVITPYNFSNGTKVTLSGGNDKYVVLSHVAGGWVATSTNGTIS